MTETNNSSIFTSRRTVLMGGLATITLGSLAACKESSDKKPNTEAKAADLTKTQPDGLPENVMGSEDAPITLIEYSSMTCPHCARFHTDVLPDLKKKYIDTGKVKYIVREFPIDALATAAFMLARCSGQDKYFPLVEALYARQSEWVVQNPVEKLMELTKQAGFTKESFDKCLSDKKLEQQIMAVRDRGSKEFGVNSTPTFFINGEKFAKAHTVAEFEKTFAPLLPGENLPKVEEEKK